MTCRDKIIALTCSVAAEAARAQTPHVNHTASWSEVFASTHAPVGSPNGVLDPGEAARVSISFSFTAVGTPVSYQWPTPGVAPVAGLSNSSFNLIATAALGGTWTQPTVPSGFEGILGLPGPDGSALICLLSQQVMAHSTNPLINAWSAVWTPPTYSARTVGFQIQQLTGSPELRPLNLWVDLGPPSNPSFGTAMASGDYGSVQIPVVPGPSILALLGLIAPFAARRRRFDRPLLKP